MDRKIKFTVFSDFHYKKLMYASTLPELDAILSRAHSSGSELVLHAGDLCNDFRRSPELLRACLDNRYGLPFYNIYGNHELESAENDMSYVTPRLTNRSVSFGAEGAGYYYFDRGGFRFICLDSNYSWLEGELVHNRTASWGAPSGACRINSLGPAQLEWLSRTLNDAVERELLCVLMSHVNLSNAIDRAPSPDAEAVRELVAEANASRRTVVLMINGHYHSDHIAERDGVVYFDCNTALNGFWMPSKEGHYTEEHTFEFEDYSPEGELIEERALPLGRLSQANNTWFFASPLSAVVTLTERGVDIEGAQTEWRYGIVPPQTGESGIHSRISSAHFEF